MLNVDPEGQKVFARVGKIMKEIQRTWSQDADQNQNRVNQLPTVVLTHIVTAKFASQV